MFFFFLYNSVNKEFNCFYEELITIVQDGEFNKKLILNVIKNH